MKTLLLLIILASASDTFIQADGAVSGERLIYFKLRGVYLPFGDGLFRIPDAFVKFAGATTSIVSHISPEWPEVWHYTYKPGTGQVFRFEVCDKDDLQGSSYDVLGTVDVNLDGLVRHEKGYRVDLSTSGSLVITITNPISFKLKANNLPNKDNWFDGQSDPMVGVYARNDQGTSQSIGESDVRLNTEDPIWPIVFTFLEYVPGTGQKLYFELVDDDWMLGEPPGEASVTIDDLKKKKGPTTLTLTKSNGYATLTIQLV